jgi:hypothetical protein
MSNLYTGLYKYKRKSLYKVARTYGENRKNVGYDYTDTVLKKTMSNHMFRNQTLIDFLGFVNDIWVKMIDSIKSYKIFKTYSVDKDYKNIN